MRHLQDRVFDALSSLSVQCHASGMTAVNDLIERMALELAAQLRHSTGSHRPDALRVVELPTRDPAP